MKKLVFVALAAFVTVSVSNVFAGSSKAELGLEMPVDTTVVETPDTPVVDDQQTEAMFSDSTDSVDPAAQLFSSSLTLPTLTLQVQKHRLLCKEEKRR